MTNGSSMRWRRNVPKALLTALVVAGAAITLMPLAWMFSSSFKTTGEILRNPDAWLPAAPTASNFADLLAARNFGIYFLNSVVVAAVCVLGNLLFSSMAGYALAKLDFVGKKVLFLLVVIMLVVPSIATFIPLFVQVVNMGLANSYFGLILPFLVTPIGVFLMRQFMEDIPTTLIEAARIDGASEWHIFLRIVMPLCGPALATLATLTFLAQWNNFLWPLVIAQSDDMYTLPVALALVAIGANGTNYGLLLAGSVVIVAPVLMLFLLLQKYFIEGVASTGIK